MFRISKAIHSTSSLSSRRLICNRKHFLVQYTGIPKNYDLQKRSYCDCKKDYKNLHKQEVGGTCRDICKARKEPVLASCKPKPITPCVPCPPTPPLDPCDPAIKKSDIVEASNLACPWEDVDKRWSEKLKKYKILAALLAASAVAYYFYYQWAQKEKKKPPVLARYFVRPQRECRCPTYGRDFPPHVPYVLVGGGTASFAAFRAIKSSDPTAKVLVINTECNYPYMRPPLSKEMWFGDVANSARKCIFKQWNGQERSVFYEPNDFYVQVPELMQKNNGGVAVARGWSVKRVDVVNKKVILDDDTEVSYDKCLIATGSKPKNLSIFEKAQTQIRNKVTLFRELFDYQELTEVVRDSHAVAVIGGGFLGSELACALGRVAKTSKKRVRTKVYQIFREDGNMAHVLPEYLCKWATERVRREGVQIVNKANVEDVSLNERCELLLHLDTGRTVTVDHVVVAVGVTPNTQLAVPSELELDPELGGYLVNTEMEARSNLYIAGDCSCFYDTKLGRRRVEHHDHAVVSGRLAGENMTGAQKPYLHQSMFWSDLGPDLGYEAIGIVDSSLPTVGVFAKEGMSKKLDKSEQHQHDSPNNNFEKGVIFYLRDDTVVGIVLWNIFNRMSIARQVLKDQKKYDDLNEVAKLFNIHECQEDDDEEIAAAVAK